MDVIAGCGRSQVREGIFENAEFADDVFAIAFAL